MTIQRIVSSIVSSIAVVAVVSTQPSHPRLMLTKAEAAEMKAALGKVPVFDTTFQRAKRVVEAALARPMDVPRPVDAGGVTHQRHKENYTEMHLAGILYAVTGEVRYAQFIRDMLMKYVDLWPTLPKHPMAASESYGRLFWQSLNETVWMVHATQAYDCIYDWLPASDRSAIEGKLFRPMAEYFIREHTSEFDRIHNHGTWIDAAVAMAGYTMNDRDLVDKALYGSKKDKKAGFLRQMELLFSPDGFYTEGPYYVRYAIMPFMVLAQVIENNEPSLKIFEFHDQILRKALYSGLQLSYTNGAFIPINDALKEKSFLSPELIIATNIVYDRYGADPGLLWVAQKHGEVLLNGAGLSVAKALRSSSSIPAFQYASVEYSDGGDGNEGGVGVLRYGPVIDQSLVLMKYTGHGLSHGHYDKLSLLYYDQGTEILQDYGAARFINVEPKYGGRYLPETKTWTRQTIAHNTVTVDEQSQYEGKESVSERHHADKHYFSTADPSLQVMSASVKEASPGVAMQRTVALVPDSRFAHPLIIDVIRVVSSREHQYDLPYYYLGHLLDANIPTTSHSEQQQSLGSRNGYEHLWLEAEGNASGPVRVSWLNGNRYYSLIAAADSGTKVLFTRIGAGDPNFNLRHEPGVIFRRKGGSTVFATVLEPHGLFDGTKEFSIGARPTVASVRVLASTDEGTVVDIEGKDGFHWTFMTTNKSASDSAEHEISAGGKTWHWKGNYELDKNEGRR